MAVAAATLSEPTLPSWGMNAVCVADGEGGRGDAAVLVADHEGDVAGEVGLGRGVASVVSSIATIR